MIDALAYNGLKDRRLVKSTNKILKLTAYINTNTTTFTQIIPKTHNSEQKWEKNVKINYTLNVNFSKTTKCKNPPI